MSRLNNSLGSDFDEEELKDALATFYFENNLASLPDEGIAIVREFFDFVFPPGCTAPEALSDAELEEFGTRLRTRFLAAIKRESDI